MFKKDANIIDYDPPTINTTINTTTTLSIFRKTLKVIEDSDY